VGALEALHKRFGNQVAFFVVYIKEAHPEDGWVLESNRIEKIAVQDPTTLEQRAQAAGTCAMKLELSIPVLLDGPENRVAAAYGGWPDRLYLIDKEGRIAFQGGEGPFGFKPEELERAIEELVVG
jgi:iodothyronine deiodinase-like protein